MPWYSTHYDHHILMKAGVLEWTYGTRSDFNRFLEHSLGGGGEQLPLLLTAWRNILSLKRLDFGVQSRDKADTLPRMTGPVLYW